MKIVWFPALAHLLIHSGRQRQVYSPDRKAQPFFLLIQTHN